jgi:hypothetical protein
MRNKMAVENRIENGSIVELTISHKLDGDCPCGATATTTYQADGSGYARYNYGKVYTHKSLLIEAGQYE